MSRGEFENQMREKMIDTITNNLKYRNLDYYQLLVINRVISHLKIKRYDDIVDDIINLKVTDLLENKLKRRGYYD